MSQSLSSSLFREVRPELFRILGGPLAALYLDALDALEKESAHRHSGMEKDEAVALIEQVVERFRGITSPGDETFTNATTNRDKARAVLDTFRQTGWITEEDSRSDYHKLIFFDANGVLLMQALRKIAFPEATVFSDKLSNVCTTLANQEALTEQPLAHVETCIDNLQSG
ncbi:MAG: Wadjet anti-phage system protein JetA family protein, partial [Limisphaerales bacterium]